MYPQFRPQLCGPVLPIAVVPFVSLFASPFVMPTRRSSLQCVHLAMNVSSWPQIECWVGGFRRGKAQWPNALDRPFLGT